LDNTELQKCEWIYDHYIYGDRFWRALDGKPDADASTGDDIHRVC